MQKDNEAMIDDVVEMLKDSSEDVESPLGMHIFFVYY